MKLPKLNRRLLLWAPGILGVANLIFATNIWMQITGVLLIVMQAFDLYE